MTRSHHQFSILIPFFISLPLLDHLKIPFINLLHFYLLPSIFLYLLTITHLRLFPYHPILFTQFPSQISSSVSNPNLESLFPILGLDIISLALLSSSLSLIEPFLLQILSHILSFVILFHAGTRISFLG